MFLFFSDSFLSHRLGVFHINFDVALLSDLHFAVSSFLFSLSLDFSSLYQSSLVTLFDYFFSSQRLDFSVKSDNFSTYFSFHVNLCLEASVNSYTIFRDCSDLNPLFLLSISVWYACT